MTYSTPTIGDAVSTWSAEPITLALVAAAAAAYAWGVLRVRAAHPAGPWPWGRAACFYAGLGVIVVARLSLIGTYDDAFFWIHMIQHLLLIMIAPVLLILGRPLILALHSTRNPWHTRIKRVLRSPVVTVLTCPLVAVPAYAAIVVITHLTSFNTLSIENPAVDAAEELAYLTVGYLYLLSGFGDEPIRWRLSRPIKIVIILFSMPIDTFTGVALLMTTTPPWPAYARHYPGWGPDLLTDVHWGGAIMWVAGDAIMMVFVVIAAIPWVRNLGGAGARLRWIEAARRHNMARYQTASPGRPDVSLRRDVDDDDMALDAYNDWLARMAERDSARAREG
ncbi:cytochrome c oxidase assembly protein [Micromonospora sp. WMMD975]|uniref:cytochrome c oxidase assembly protein n=1 Tax=Micromonospora sp. WMMD975 TaxID=3016087 RepID=UPI00249A7F43|nr:cytochrome c oxidase assembly protein [Micromonospora sp. WMMD975]WFE30932.1 cytochrome c oxidase assembly protein [Micromonospora sp. WMMD975]